MESSRTHFEVFGLEASSPQKLACPRLEDSTFFELLKYCRSPEKKFLEGGFYWRTPENFFEQFFFFMENTCACVFGPWPWPRAFLSLSLALASDFFCVLGLGLEPCVLDSTFVVDWYWTYSGLESKKTFWGISKSCGLAVPLQYCQCYTCIGSSDWLQISRPWKRSTAVFLFKEPNSSLRYYAKKDIAKRNLQHESLVTPTCAAENCNFSRILKPLFNSIALPKMSNSASINARLSSWQRWAVS